MALPPLPRRLAKIFHSPGPPINDDDEIYADFTEEEEMYHQFLKISGTSDDEGKDSGVYSTEEFCKLKLTGDINLGDIIRCVNTGDPKEVSEMIQHIHTCTIPEAVSGRDLETLAQLLDCDHKAIETRVSRLMSEVLLELDTKRHHFTNLLSCLRILFVVLQKRAMKPDSMHRIQPVVILVLLVLHHQCLNHHDREQISVATRDTLQTYIDITEKLGTLDATPTLVDLRLSMQMVLAGLHDVLMKAKMSHLQLGNFSEELRNDSHRKRLSKEFSKMSILEHYSLVFGVMIQISKFPVSVETLDFLRLCIESVLNFYKKSKLEKPIYGLLLLATRAIINVLEKSHMKHILHSAKGSLQDKLCDILEMIISSPKIRKDVRQALQDEVTVILFHESGRVVQRVTGIIDKKTSSMLNETLLTYLTRSLERLNFSSHSSTMGEANLKWYSLQGCIVGHIDVTTHVFLPSLDTMQNGTFDLDKYHQSAIQVAQTAKHFNTLKALRKMSAHGPSEHVQRLLAFQTEPLPMFYVAETLPEITLSHHLLTHRKNRKWISEKQLGLVSLGAVKALRFVHDAGFIHRNVTAASFRYRNQTAVLEDFSIVRTSRTHSHGFGENNTQAAGEIPIRWSSYESLCEDEFSCASDVWMYGQLLYEIFTHGCHPYTDLYGYDLDDVMEMVLFHDLKPKWYPCIPRAIHDVIKGCVRTPPSERMCLRNAEETIERWLDAPISQASHSGEITFSSRKNLYPELNQLQKDSPERGTTLKLRQLKSIGGDAKSLYYNGLQKRKIPADSLQITERALAAPDRPVIRKEGIYLHVEEPVTQRFIDGPLNGMKSDEEFAKKQHIVNFPPQKKPRECTHDSGLSHTLLYRCFDGKCLLDVANECMYGDPIDSENELDYANTIKEAVLFVSDMHKMNWIIRDICCSTLFKSKTKGKVFMPRLGRFLMCQSPEGYIKDTSTNTDDRRNWMPIDVIQDRTYSMASDVYMLAMAIYEFYTAASVARNNPLGNRLNAVPFATVAPEQYGYLVSWHC
ncbi:uncharacterized protein [Argopecten irradians]|uniref:uncharacterized protein isoform X2 n=1 Tax=Argopecten irradians TaxID=31199 RepID=UPI003720045B